MKIFVRLMLCWMISFTLINIPAMKSAHAGMISTNKVVEDISRAEAHKKVADFLGRDDVKAQLIKLGVSPEEATVRLVGLSDAQMRKAAGDIDQSIAGGNVGGILVLVLVVLMIIYFAKRI